AGLCLPGLLLIAPTHFAIAQGLDQAAAAEKAAAPAEIAAPSVEPAVVAAEPSPAVENVSVPAEAKITPAVETEKAVQPTAEPTPQVQSSSSIFKSDQTQTDKKQRSKKKKLNPTEKKMQDFETVWRKKLNGAKTPDEREVIRAEYLIEKDKYGLELQRNPPK
ncbi:MAG: hypothetical protein KBD53_08805, partial [Candidatus Omnitrophica bacterium]|nr:hypothetical protein [Candidatus Omnitrophota bacterium]